MVDLEAQMVHIDDMATNWCAAMEVDYSRLDEVPTTGTAPLPATILRQGR